MKPARKKSKPGAAKKGQTAAKKSARSAPFATPAPVTLEQARALARARNPRRAAAAAAGTAQAMIDGVSPGSVAAERKKLALQRRRENEGRIREYKAVMEIMKERGVKGLGAEPGPPGAKRSGRKTPGPARAPRAAPRPPLQVFAEGDSWFEYPVPFFGGGIIRRLEKMLGVPVLNLAKAGDEVRFMLGVEERKILTRQLREGSPAGGPWDVLLFSGGGNDIVDNPMALWIKDYAPGVPPAKLLHQPRYDAALALVRAGYEDLIALRDRFSPGTHLVFHAYDFAIPDGRGICHLGPWMKPAFDLRGFPAGTAAFGVVKVMLKQFAALVQSLTTHNGVTFINGQGTLLQHPDSWHNELHPAKDGFKKFAALFHAKLKTLFPGRVL